MIILDLEWNSGCDGERLEEILQIGAVKVERLGGAITDTFCVYIKPEIHREFCLNAKLLPELEQSCRSEINFPRAAEMFLDWCGGETRFAAWGTGDFKVLQQNARRWEMDCTFPEDALNLQSAFSHTLQAGRQIALYKAVEYCRIPTAFTFHNALNDAVYAALVARYITPEAVALAQSGLRKIKREDAALRKGWTGPFQSWQAALNSGANRHPGCLYCEKSWGIGQWFYHKPERCCAMIHCSDHGRFLCSLELTEEKGQWWVKRSILPMTLERRKEYLAAKKSHVFDCSRVKKPRRKRRCQRGKKEAG